MELVLTLLALPPRCQGYKLHSFTFLTANFDQHLSHQARGRVTTFPPLKLVYPGQVQTSMVSLGQGWGLEHPEAQVPKSFLGTLLLDVSPSPQTLLDIVSIARLGQLILVAIIRLCWFWCRDEA